MTTEYPHHIDVYEKEKVNGELVEVFKYQVTVIAPDYTTAVARLRSRMRSPEANIVRTLRPRIACAPHGAFAILKSIPEHKLAKFVSPPKFKEPTVKVGTPPNLGRMLKEALAKAK